MPIGASSSSATVCARYTRISQGAATRSPRVRVTATGINRKEAPTKSSEAPNFSEVAGCRDPILVHTDASSGAMSSPAPGLTAKNHEDGKCQPNRLESVRSAANRVSTEENWLKMT